MLPLERTDERLLAGAPRDGEAFARFYRRHAATLPGNLTRRIGDAAVAADLTAGTFAAALQHALTARVLQQREYAEIATSNDTSESVIGKRVSRALARRVPPSRSPSPHWRSSPCSSPVIRRLRSSPRRLPSPSPVRASACSTRQMASPGWRPRRGTRSSSSEPPSRTSTTGPAR